MNAVFTDENVARAETDRAHKSGAFQHIRLVHMVGTEKTVLLESGALPGAKAAAARGKAGRQPAKPARKKQVTSAQLIGRISTLITLILIGGVVLYAAEFLMTK